MEPDKEDNKFVENDNIYKNKLDFEEDDYDVDAETIVINEEETHSKPEESQKPVAPIAQVKKRKPIKPIKKRKVVKKQFKKVTKTTRRKKQKEKTPAWPWIILLLAIAVVVIILVWKSSTTTTPTQETNNSVVATVNGEEITLSDINRKYESLNPAYKSLFTPELLLNQSIDEKLLIQEAKDRGIVVSDEDVNSFIDELMLENGMTQDELEARLAEQGLTINYLKEIYGNQLVIDKLLNTTVLSNIEVSEEKATEYYEDNSESFLTTEQAKVRHILVGTDIRTEEEAETIINEVNDKLESGSDFCDLVEEYSEDTGSLETCGEYTFPKGQMVPQFEEASFRLVDGETEIVKSDFGFHLIEKLESINAGLVPFEDVREGIKNSLIYQVQQELYEEYIVDLRSKAVIDIDYSLLKTEEPSFEVVTGDVTLPVDVEVSEDAVEEPEEEIVQEETVEEVVQEVVEEVVEEVVDLEPVEPEETQEEEPVEIVKEPIDSDTLIVCLEDESLTLYGAFWKKDVKDQKDLLGGLDYTYIECDGNHPDGNPLLCEDISTYPTWNINGDFKEGVFTLEELGNLAGC